MTTYTAIASTEVDADSPLTDTLMTRLRDNPLAIAEGASGAPKVMAAALNVTSNTLTGSVSAGATVEVTLGAYAFLPSCNGPTLGFGLGRNGASADDAAVSINNGTGASVSYTIRWRSLS